MANRLAHETSPYLLQHKDNPVAWEPWSEHLVKELQEHVRAETAPYKYPRIVDFVDVLPKTASGKIKRAELRG